MALPIAGTTAPEGGASLFLSPQPHLSLGPSPLPPLSLGLSPSPPLSLGSSPPFLLYLPQPLFNSQVAFPPPPPWSNGLEARASFYFYEDRTSLPCRSGLPRRILNWYRCILVEI
ncbi:unnamed protein product [Prunus armeniaca]|uniref:Uncharacterized protein n=1 Tax=Prunus armeniaca TaxID=36596 RepID=A0A6J5TPJ3_PRUAR|nr:unnamed protein product [Prunus armeniaca]